MKYKIKFELRKANSELKPIRCRVSIPDYRVDFNIGVSVYVKDWDKKHERVKNTNKNYQSINNKISNIEYNLSNYLMIASINNQKITKDNIISIFRQKNNDNRVEQIFDLYIKDVTAKHSLTKTTIVNYKSTKKMFISLFPDIKINDITDETLQKTIDKLVQKGYKNSSIHQLIIRIKTFIRWAKKNNLYSNNADKFEYKIKGIGYKEIIYLEWNELNDLMKVKTNNITEEKVLDLFIFSCFTGLRYSDIINITKGNIHGDKIHITSQKTNTTTTIEINDFSRSILLKYNYHLPYIPIQKASSVIRILAKRANINEDTTTTYYCGNERITDIQPKYQVLTFHAARRTFVTTALALGIPSEVIMKWTGHKQFSTLKHYAEVVNALKEENMKKFNTKLKK